MISFIIIGISGIIAKDAEKPSIQIPVSMTQILSWIFQMYDGPINKKPSPIKNLPVHRRTSLLTFPIIFTTITPERIGNINGNAKNMPYRFSLTFISFSLFERIAGEKFSNIKSMMARSMHFRMTYKN